MLSTLLRVVDEPCSPNDDFGTSNQGFRMRFPGGEHSSAIRRPNRALTPLKRASHGNAFGNAGSTFQNLRRCSESSPGPIMLHQMIEIRNTRRTSILDVALQRSHACLQLLRPDYETAEPTPRRTRRARRVWNPSDELVVTDKCSESLIDSCAVHKRRCTTPFNTTWHDAL